MDSAVMHLSVSQKLDHRIGITVFPIQGGLKAH